MNLRCFSRASALSVLGLAGACTAGSEGPDSSGSDLSATTAVAFDVDDVAILVPLPKAGADARAKLADKGKHGQLLSADAFKAMIGFGHTADDPTFARNHFDDPTRWRVVSLRADACARLAPGVDETASDCQAQLRLVAQPLEGDGSPADQAIHLVYDVPASELPQLARDLAAVKQGSPAPTSGKPLGPHPGLAAEARPGPFAAKVRDLVATYAGEDRLDRVAAMFTLNAGTWVFVGAQNQGGELVHVQVPCLSAGGAGDDADRKDNVALAGTTGVIGNFIGHTRPDSTCADNINAIVDSSGKDKPPAFRGSFWSLDDQTRDADVQAALRIENPAKNTLATIECVSCHHATRALARVKGVAFLDAKDGNPDRFVPPSSVTATYAADPTDAAGPYSVHAFGYLGTTASYTQRVVNEAAVSAAQFTRILAKSP